MSVLKFFQKLIAVFLVSLILMVMFSALCGFIASAFIVGKVIVTYIVTHLSAALVTLVVLPVLVMFAMEHQANKNSEN